MTVGIGDPPVAATPSPGWRGIGTERRTIVDFDKELDDLGVKVARAFRFGALITATVMLAISVFATTARAAESRPTIVFAHGAFAAPAGWERVVNALHKDGYQTATPALGLESVAGDVEIVQATLNSIPGDKILVGHSYGGFVITNAAVGRHDVRGLVYTAAYAPDINETITTLGEGYTPGAFLDHLVPAPRRSRGSSSIHGSSLRTSPRT